MDSGPHSLQHGSHLIGDAVSEADNPVLGHRGVLGESPRLGDTEELHVFTDVPPVILTLKAVVAWDVGLHRDSVSHPEASDVLSHLYNLPGGLMAEHDGQIFHPVGGPLVPIVDMQIRTADGGGMDLHQHLVLSNLRNGEIRSVFRAPAGSHLTDSAHGSPHRNVHSFYIKFSKKSPENITIFETQPAKKLFVTSCGRNFQGFIEF